MSEARLSLKVELDPKLEGLNAVLKEITPELEKISELGREIVSRQAAIEERIKSALSSPVSVRSEGSES
jgi:hypothetical protein